MILRASWTIAASTQDGYSLAGEMAQWLKYPWLHRELRVCLGYARLCLRTIVHTPTKSKQKISEVWAGSVVHACNSGTQG